MGKPDFDTVRELHEDPEFYQLALGIESRIPSEESLRMRMDAIGNAYRERLLNANIRILVLSYPDENSFVPEQEARFLEEKAESPNETELIAIIDGKVAGTAGIEAVGKKYKVKHRAEFGISVLKEYWGLGLGKALTKACIQCAKNAGYDQLELNVVADNDRALSLYRSLGFEEFGRNPRGFNSQTSGYQELVYMMLKL
jgi:RimJ/RimL family protein N-acetyltransferase